MRKLFSCVLALGCWLVALVPVLGAADDRTGVVDAALRDERNQPKDPPADTLITMGDRVVLTIKDLDGWLYEEARANGLAEQHWFDVPALRLMAQTDLGALFDASKDPVAPAERSERDRVRQLVGTMIREVRQKLYLQIGPARLRSIHAEDPFVKQDHQGLWRMVFVVSNADNDKEEWAKLRNVHGQERAVSVSAAFDLKSLAGESTGSYTLPSVITAPADSVTVKGAAQSVGMRFQVYSPFRAITFLVCYVVVLVLFAGLADKPDLLRDPDGPVRSGWHVFSLSRFVLAWWFFLVLGAWVFLWVLTGALDAMNSTALLLTGIGSATALGGTLAGKVRDAVASDPDARPAQVVIDSNGRPRGFRTGLGALLYDLLCDENAIGFHRFQTLVWNGVLGLVFAAQAWSNFAMPSFDSTILGLLGISSATFVGFKMTPNQTRTQPVAEPKDEKPKSELSAKSV